MSVRVAIFLAAKYGRLLSIPDVRQEQYDAISCVCVCFFRFIVTINVKNFHGSLTTVVRAQNDTTKTANITDTIFDRTLV